MSTKLFKNSNPFWGTNSVSSNRHGHCKPGELLGNWFVPWRRLRLTHKIGMFEPAKQIKQGDPIDGFRTSRLGFHLKPSRKGYQLQPTHTLRTLTGGPQIVLRMVSFQVSELRLYPGPGAPFEHVDRRHLPTRWPPWHADAAPAPGQ